MGSILTETKKLLGVTEADTNFDTDIIIHINSAFMNLNQLGIGENTGFRITSKTAVWTDFTTKIDVEAMKTYVYLKVRLLFDPPQTGYLVEAINKQISELEWRLNVQAETILGGEDE